MTPKEWQAIYELVEWTAKTAYDRGREDERDGVKRPDDKHFKLSKARQLELKTGFEKALRPSTKKR